MNLSLIELAVIELFAAILIPFAAALDKRMYEKVFPDYKANQVLSKEFLIQCFWEFLIFNFGLLVGIAVMVVECRI